METIMNNPEVKCDKCNGFGYDDDAHALALPCRLCHGAGVISGKHLASSLEYISIWLGLTGNQLRLRKYRGKWEAQVFNQGRIGLGEGNTMQEALTKAFDMAIEFMNDEYLERVTSAPIRV